MLPPVRASGAAARPAGRARLSALHRGSRQVFNPDSAPGRVSWSRRVQTGGPSPAPVQRAPRGPVIVPDERGPKAARERFARPRAGTAPTPYFGSHPECVPSMGGLFAQLLHLSPLSRTNEFAFGVFLSARKQTGFARGAVDFARPAGRWRRKCMRHGRKDSLAQSSRVLKFTASPASLPS